MRNADVGVHDRVPLRAGERLPRLAVEDAVGVRMAVWFASSVFARCRFSIFGSRTDQVGHCQVIIFFFLRSGCGRRDVVVAVRALEQVLEV